MSLDARVVEKALAERDYAGLERRLAAEPVEALLPAWVRLSPMGKLVVFKLLDAVRAMEFFRRLGVADRYLVFCGFPLQAVAPVLEGLPASERRSFVQLPREDYDRMFRLLLQGAAAAA